MSNLHSPPLSRGLWRGLVSIALVPLLTTLPAIANAATLCEAGRITLLEHRQGDHSYIVVATEKSPAADSKRYPLTVLTADKKKQMGTQIWYDSNGVRWRDRFSMLRTAFALQQPIIITSWDGNCMGPTDEFYISLCVPGQGCD